MKTTLIDGDYVRLSGSGKISLITAAVVMFKI